MFYNSLQSMDICKFCAKKNERIHKISEQIVVSNKTATIQEVLKIFRSEITKVRKRKINITK